MGLNSNPSQPSYLIPGLPSAMGNSVLVGTDASGNLASYATPLTVTIGGTGTATQFTSGSIVFAGTSGIYSQNNTKLFWDNTNYRLGVGTVSPNSTLHVAGAVTISSMVNNDSFSIAGAAASANQSIDVQLAPGGGAYNYLKVNFGGKDLWSWGAALSAYASVMTLNNPLNGSLIFKTNDTTAITIDNTQKVGIGVLPSYTLDVGGTIAVANSTSSSYAFYLRDPSGTAANQYFEMDIAKGGGSYNYIKFAMAGSDFLTVGAALSAYAGVFTISNAYDNSLVFKTNATLRWTIDNKGNFYPVGGTTSMTNGFNYVPSGAGVPSGTPANLPTGTVPLYFDTTNGRLYFYHGAAWHYVDQTA